MLITGLAALVSAAAFLLPGFLIQLAAGQRRDYERQQNPFDLTLRALLWSLVVQVIAFPWIARVAREVDDADRWFDHLDLVVPYLLVVLLVGPVVAGWMLGRLADWSDRHSKRPPRLLARALGAEPGEDASWPRALERLSGGAWVVAHTTDGRVIGGAFSSHSLAPVTPDWRDLFVESQWTFGEDDVPVAPMAPPRSLWIERSGVESISIMPFPVSTTQE